MSDKGKAVGFTELAGFDNPEDKVAFEHGKTLRSVDDLRKGLRALLAGYVYPVGTDAARIHNVMSVLATSFSRIHVARGCCVPGKTDVQKCEAIIEACEVTFDIMKQSSIAYIEEFLGVTVVTDPEITKPEIVWN